MKFVFLILVMHVACPAEFLLLDCIALVTLGAELAVSDFLQSAVLVTLNVEAHLNEI
jgi:hypothetical protein